MTGVFQERDYCTCTCTSSGGHSVEETWKEPTQANAEDEQIIPGPAEEGMIDCVCICVGCSQLHPCY